MQPLALSEFADRVGRIMPVIMKEFARRQTDELYKGKITLPQFLLMESLYGQGGSKMTALAESMHVSTAAMTGIVDRLVRDGYVARALDPGDRRIIKVRLTTQGNFLVRNISEQRRRMILKTFEPISPRDRQEYLRILMQIKDILTKA